MSDTLSDVVLTELLHNKNKIIVDYVRHLTVKQKRKIFAILRKTQADNYLNYIMPAYHGITVGEFCTAHVLQNNTKRGRNSSSI